MGNRAQLSKQEQKHADCWLIYIAVCLLVIALDSLFVFSPLAYLPLTVIDVYLALALFFVAFKADMVEGAYKGEAKALWFLPSRRIGVVLLTLMAITTIIAFAGLYYGMPAWRNFTGYITTHVDALYFSFSTLMTVGYGHIAPLSEAARWIAMWEFANSALFLLGVFPVLVSRVSEF